jgi:hypothetical protein
MLASSSEEQPFHFAKICLAFAGFLLIVSGQAALAVKASPPTVTCTGQCEACIESEVLADGSSRCVKCGIDQKCTGNLGLSSDFTELLQATNADRGKHGTPSLTWSSDLAQGAQQWADACTPDPKNPDLFAHSPGAFQNYGENLSWGTRRSATEAVQSWYDELSRYDFNNPIASYTAGNTDHSREVRDFTQLIWNDTQQVGCGVSVCKGFNFWVCRYSPPGNFNGENPGVLDKEVPRAIAASNASSQGSGGGIKPQSVPIQPQSGGQPAQAAGRNVSVPQDVDVYAEPGGVGTPSGTLNAGSGVSLLETRPDQWCHVAGDTVPQGNGWVWCGKDFELKE